MPISWTLIVLGTLLQGMQCNANDDTTTASNGTPPLTTVNATTAYSTKSTITLITLSSTKPIISSASLASTTLATTLTSLVSTKATTSASLTSTTLAPTLPSSELTKPVAQFPTLASTTLATALTSSETTEHPSSSPSSTKQAALMTSKGTSPEPTGTSSTVAKKDLPSNTSSQNALVTTQITTIQPKTSNAGTTQKAFKNNPQNLTTNVITTNPIQVITKLNKPETSISTDSTTQLLSTQTNPSDVTRNSTLPSTAAPDSKSTASQSLGTTKAQTTTASIIPGQRSDEDTSNSTHSYDLSSSTEENIVRQACKTLGQKMKGNCSVTITINDKRLIAKVIIDADQKIPPGNYQPTKLEPISGVTNNDALQKDDENKDTIPDTLIAILASCGALVLILCCFAAYCTYHRRSYRKNQQHLTEELQTVENGYHDNPTLEVMEVQPEMQEKKLKLNGEFNDSWIVPIDNLLKEDITDEEDTHL